MQVWSMMYESTMGHPQHRKYSNHYTKSRENFMRSCEILMRSHDNSRDLVIISMVPLIIANELARLDDYHSRRSSKKIRRPAEDVQIERTEAEVYSNIDLDLSFAYKHVLSHCHLSVIPLLLRSRRKTKKHSIGFILANRVERIQSSLLRRSSVW